MTNQRVFLENAALREELEEQRLLEGRAKSIVAAYMYHKQLERRYLMQEIDMLKVHINKLASEISTYKLSDDENVQYDEKGDIKQASLGKLIDSLFLHTKDNDIHQKAFLETHRCFTTTHEVLIQLMESYKRLANSNNASGNRLRVGNFFCKLLDPDFNFDPADRVCEVDLLLIPQELLLSFVTATISVVDPPLAAKLENTAKGHGISRTASKPALPISSIPAPIIPKPLNLPIHFLDIHPLELARQLTWLDFNLCRAIEGKEFIGLAFSKKDKESRSPNVVKMTDHFNNISKWMAWLLVSEYNLKKRAKILKRLLQVLQHVKDLQNYNAIIQIVGCMGRAPVHRLQKTFAEMKADKLKILEESAVLCEKNWKKYRHEIHHINPPCVPYVGLYQTDLTMLEEMPQILSTGHINWQKFIKIAKVIAELRQYQRLPYSIEPVAVIQDFILKSSQYMPKMTDDDLFGHSLIAEPRTD